jgi:hypothetical protein
LHVVALVLQLGLRPLHFRSLRFVLSHPFAGKSEWMGQGCLQQKQDCSR